MKKVTIINLTIYIILILVMFLLPFFSFDGYSILAHTTSHLGAQLSPHNWMMNLVFIIIGITVIIETIYFSKQITLITIPLVLFGVGLIGVAVFLHAPLVESQSYNGFADIMHSVAANTVGTAFTVYAISMIFIFEKKRHKTYALILSVLVIVLPLLMTFIPPLMGLFQRIMFMISFGWLVCMAHMNQMN